MMLTTTSKVNAVKKYAREKDYKNAAGIAEKINLQKVQSKHDLAAIADVYLKLGRYEAAKEVYTELYTRHKSHKVMTGLIELCLKTKDPKQAEVYVREFRKMEPDNPERLIYRYRVDCMLGKSPEYLIRSLSKLKEEEYTDIWALELAKAYYKAGEILACSAECRSILQWFGDSEVAPKAKVLLDACEDVTLLDSQKEAVAASISAVDEESVFPAVVQKESAPSEEVPEVAVAEPVEEVTEYFVDLGQLVPEVAGEYYAQPSEELVSEEPVAAELPVVESSPESAVSIEAETSPEEDLDVPPESLAEEVSEELAYELPENLKGKIDRVFFDDDDDDDDDHDDDDDDDDHDDDEDDDDHDDDDDDDHDDDDDDDEEDDDDDDDEFDEDEYVIRGYFTDEEIGISEEKQTEAVEEVVEEAVEAVEELPVVEESEAIVAPSELETAMEETVDLAVESEEEVAAVTKIEEAVAPVEEVGTLPAFEYWESEPAEEPEEVSSDAWGKSLSMAFETAYSEAKAQAGKPEANVLPEVLADALAEESANAPEAVEEPTDAMDEVIEEAMEEIIEEDAVSEEIVVEEVMLEDATLVDIETVAAAFEEEEPTEGVSVEAIAEDIRAFAEEIVPEGTSEEMIPQSVNMTEFFPEESDEDEEPEFILPTFRGFEYEDRLQPEEEQDDLYTNKRFEMKSFISKKVDDVAPVEDDDDDDMPNIAIPDQAKADMYKALLEDEEAEEAAEALEAAEQEITEVTEAVADMEEIAVENAEDVVEEVAQETATEVLEKVTEEAEEPVTEAEDLEVTKVHGDLTAQALDAVFREDDKAIERALYNLLADEK